MNHDEELGCGNSHIQSATTGAGKTVWSSCSINQIRNYLSSIRNQKYKTIFTTVLLLSLRDSYIKLDFGVLISTLQQHNSSFRL